MSKCTLLSTFSFLLMLLCLSFLGLVQIEDKDLLGFMVKHCMEVHTSVF